MAGLVSLYKKNFECPHVSVVYVTHPPPVRTKDDLNELKKRQTIFSSDNIVTPVVIATRQKLPGSFWWAAREKWDKGNATTNLFVNEKPCKWEILVSVLNCF